MDEHTIEHRDKEVKNKIEHVVLFLEEICSGDVKLTYRNVNVFLNFLEAFGLQWFYGEWDGLDIFVKRYIGEENLRIIRNLRCFFLHHLVTKDNDIVNCGIINRFINFISFDTFLNGLLQFTRNVQTNLNQNIHGQYANIGKPFLLRGYETIETRAGEFLKPSTIQEDLVIIRKDKELYTLLKEKFLETTADDGNIDFILNQQTNEGNIRLFLPLFQKFVLLAYSHEPSSDFAEECMFDLTVNIGKSLQKLETRMIPIRILRNNLAHDFCHFQNLSQRIAYFKWQMYQNKEILFRFYFAEEVNEYINSINGNNEPNLILKSLKNKLNDLQGKLESTRHLSVMPGEMFEYKELIHVPYFIEHFRSLVQSEWMLQENQMDEDEAIRILEFKVRLFDRDKLYQDAIILEMLWHLIKTAEKKCLNNLKPLIEFDNIVRLVENSRHELNSKAFLKAMELPSSYNSFGKFGDSSFNIPIFLRNWKEELNEPLDEVDRLTSEDQQRLCQAKLYHIIKQCLTEASEIIKSKYNINQPFHIFHSQISNLQILINDIIESFEEIKFKSPQEFLKSIQFPENQIINVKDYKISSNSILKRIFRTFCDAISVSQVKFNRLEAIFSDEDFLKLLIYRDERNIFRCTDKLSELAYIYHRVDKLIKIYFMTPYVVELICLRLKKIKQIEKLINKKNLTILIKNLLRKKNYEPFLKKLKLSAKCDNRYLIEQIIQQYSAKMPKKFV